MLLIMTQFSKKNRSLVKKVFVCFYIWANSLRVSTSVPIFRGFLHLFLFSKGFYLWANSPRVSTFGPILRGFLHLGQFSKGFYIQANFPRVSTSEPILPRFLHMGQFSEGFYILANSPRVVTYGCDQSFQTNVQHMHQYSAAKSKLDCYSTCNYLRVNLDSFQHLIHTLS